MVMILFGPLLLAGSHIVLSFTAAIGLLMPFIPIATVSALMGLLPAVNL